MKGIIAKIIAFTAYTNLIVASAAAAFCQITLTLLGEKHLSITAFVFFATLLMYAYAQWFESPRRASEATSKLTQWQQQNPVFFYGIALFGLIGTFYFGFKLSSQVYIWLFFCAFISALYPLQFVKRGTALRNIPGLKLMVIGVVWAVVTTIIPALAAGAEVDFLVISLTIQRFFYVSALALAFDIRDVRIDSPQIGTLPYQIGVKKSRITGTFFVFLAEVMAVVLFFLDGIGLAGLIAMLMIFEFSSLLIYRASPKKPDFYFSVAIDSLPIVLLIALYIFSYFWP